MTVAENLDLGCYRRGAAAPRGRTARGCSRSSRASPSGSRQRAGTLSGGEQQMLAIGRGLMAEPKLLILDEPSLGLSPLLVEELFALIRTHQRGRHRALLVEQNVVQSLEVAAARLYPRQRRVCAAGKRRRDPRRSRPQARLSGNVDNDRCGEPCARASRRKPIVVAPGVYDAFTALVATQAGFATLYVSGAAIAYTRLGRPDIGLVGMSEVAETIALIRDRVECAADRRCRYRLRQCAQRRAHGACIRARGRRCDPARGPGFPQALRPSRRQGADPGRPRWSARSRRRSMRARSADTLVIARTDAVAVEGFERAIERAVRYREAGADMLFVEAPKTREELARIVTALGTSVPLMANMVEGGKTPLLLRRRARGDRLCAGDLPRRHRARARPHRERILRLARRARHDRAVPRPHARFRRRSTR